MALEHVERRAARMRARRKELGLTQEAVADRMQEIHAERHPDAPADQTRGQMVSDWERAVNEPSPKKLELLAAALDWTVGDLNTDPPELSATPDPFEPANGPRPDSELLREVAARQIDLGLQLSSTQAQLQELLRRLPEPGEGSGGQ